jgi:hypothetical protein
MTRPLAAALAGTLLATFAVPAAADSIDGKWCRKDGRRLEIQGSLISTPGGQGIQGHYGRHVFTYKVPDGEEWGGTERQLRLVRDQYIYAYPSDNPSAQPEIWERCEPVG